MISRSPVLACTDGTLLEEGPRAVEACRGGRCRCPSRRARRRPCARCPRASGCPAYAAPLIAPTDAPKTRSARMPRRTSSSSMPTWTAPRLPPPASTNAVRCGVPPCPPDLPSAPWRPCRRCRPPKRARRRAVQVGSDASLPGPLPSTWPSTSTWPSKSAGPAALVTASPRVLVFAGPPRALLARPPRPPPGDVVAHRPHDDDHDQHDHRDDEDPEDDEEGGVGGRRQQTRAGAMHSSG